MNIKFRVIEAVSPYIPPKFRTMAREYISMADYDRMRRSIKNPHYEATEEDFANCPVRLGIFIEPFDQRHQYYINACREKSISFRIIELTAPERLMTHLIEDNCDAYLVWPSSGSTVIKQFFDFRLYLIENELGKRIFPTWKECWLTEHKPRLRDWLDANGFPHPRTWIFNDRQHALEFAEHAKLPMVAKTATGASASGIKVLHTKKELQSIISKAFGKGLRPRGHDVNDRQWGFIYLQEYLEGVHEWRMVRIGNSYFGYRKEKGPSGLHSASHKWSWLDPGETRLNLLKAVTDKGGFYSMNVDLFEKADGTLLVNELQTTFGCWTPEIQMKVNNVEGRYIHDNGNWVFEPGSYCANQMCNLRLDYLYRTLTLTGR